MQRYAARGFYLWYIFLLGDLLYRQFYLHQSVFEYWDIFVIFFAGCIYVSVAYLIRGAYTDDFKRRFILTFIPVFSIVMLTLYYFRGDINSPGDLMIHVLILVIFFSFFLPVLYYLNRRWEKKCELED